MLVSSFDRRKPRNSRFQSSPELLKEVAEREGSDNVGCNTCR